LDTTSKPATLKYLNYTWSKVANVIYLESPIGVGFSYSDNPDEYTWNDDTTASDNMKSVEKFFELFPEYGNNSFYIAGESYGGIYVPTLAEVILNATFSETYKGAPLKGIAVGNGATGLETGYYSWPDRTAFDLQFLVENTAFISQSLQKKINENCDWDNPTNISNTCIDLAEDIRNQTEGDKGLNEYNIYGEKKIGSKDWGNLQLEEYIKQENFIDASQVKEDIIWKICNTDVNGAYIRTSPNLPRDTYPFLNDHVSVLIYNGDWDRAVPYTDNAWWTRNMGYPVSQDWHPWLYQDGNQLGGYATTYETKYNFTFITVRGGAHAVPATAPAKAFEMISRFLSGSPF
jgi:carboxypeptidase C (cathepsin A)